MRVKYPAMKAALDSHTVETPHGRVAGFLVRCSSSHYPLGWVWSAGNAWRWRTPDGQHAGERSSQQAAVRVLRDAYDLRRQPSLLDEQNQTITKAWTAPVLPPMKPRRVDAPKKERRRQAARPKPVVVDEPPTKIDWSKHATGDVTAALAAALREKK